MPPGVRPDTLDGVTYVGLIPFRMVGAGIARGPGVPWFGSFLETNVRLYSVDDTGRRGIVFLSLDAERAAVVLGARAVFGLPYRWSRMRYRASGDVHSYERASAAPVDRWKATSWSARAQGVGEPSSTTSSAHAGDCTWAGGAGRCTSRTATRLGRCTPRKCCPSTTV